jgi:hypothetical protein
MPCNSSFSDSTFFVNVETEGREDEYWAASEADVAEHKAARTAFV